MRGFIRAHGRKDGRCMILFPTVINSVYARKPRTTAYGLETISFLGQNLWRDLPLHIKKSQSVKHFKKHIKVWNFICNYRLCKSFVVNLGYI